jgi:hypothetical protein
MSQMCLTSSSSSCGGSSTAVLGEMAVIGESFVDTNARFLIEVGPSFSCGRLRDSMNDVVRAQPWPQHKDYQRSAECDKSTRLNLVRTRRVSQRVIET